MEKFYNFKNRQIHYLEINKNFKKNVLLIHGFTSEIGYLEEVYKLFENEYNIYAIDLPTHGQSEIANELMNMESFRDLVIDFVTNKNLHNLTLVGHSMGGGVSATVSPYLEKYLDKVILLAPMNRTMLKYNYKWPLFFPRNLEDYKKLIPVLFYNPEPILTNVETLKQVEKKFSDENTHKRLDVIYDWGYKMPEEHNQIIVDEGIKNCPVPLALINGDHDGIVDVELCNDHYLKLNKKTKHYVIKNSGHSMWFENPVDFKAAILDFINS
ncbi:alpha/beta fold hydrolase [Mycoplasma miroungirhinis]|uniref:Alpha/beta hydrolase n=1 Tax=Mycoplasma miroungirhinis TaxID=754516 RepID=A0A6M4JGQ4_9MOLU|nr:alpha/beta hydrolase [Mycoplasma miroungirhinis]QJR44192.1 alpha/beta hydrolase [Mycoplasma miroungirhinis]